PPAPQDVAPPARKLWTTPTVTEISIDDLPTELRMMALGLPVPDRPEDSTWRKLPAQAVVRGGGRGDGRFSKIGAGIRKPTRGRDFKIPAARLAGLPHRRGPGAARLR